MRMRNKKLKFIFYCLILKLLGHGSFVVRAKIRFNDIGNPYTQPLTSETTDRVIDALKQLGRACNGYESEQK